MNERALLEARYDVMPDTVAALRNETPEAFRLRKLAMLKGDIEHLAKARAFLLSLKPGDRICFSPRVPIHQQPIATEERIKADLADNARRLDEAHEALVEYAMTESEAACMRAELWLARAIKPVEVG